MFRMIFITSACAALLGACATAGLDTYVQKNGPFQEITLTPQQIATIETKWRNRLKDPESARFKGFRASQMKSGPIAVCGWVNAKNSLGGYTGFEPFAGELIGDKFTIGGHGEQEGMTSRIFLICEASGIPIELN